MNKYNARENWSVIKAWSEGKLVQSKGSAGSKWDDDMSPQWYDNRYYRVKPYDRFYIDLSQYTDNIRKVISKAIQETAFTKGYMWIAGDRYIRNTDKPFLYFDYVSKCITYADNVFSSSTQTYEQVNIEDFLTEGTL